jgi:uncharacterized protein (TIGR02147 family)
MPPSPQLPQIYDFASFASFFAACMRARQAADRKLSYRQLCRKLQIDSPSKLSMIAANRRVPAPGFAAAICAALGLDTAQGEYAEALVALQRARTGDERQAAGERLGSLRQRDTTRELDARSFEMISQWHHLAILELSALPTFRADPSWIRRRFGGRIKTEDARQSLALLEAAGVLARDEDGLLRRTALRFTTSRNVPSDAIRNYHRQILQLAGEALYLQSVDERYVSSTTVSIDPAKMPEAQRLIAEFRDRFTGMMHGGTPSETYNLSMQFFRLTEPEGNGDA